jgi:LysM domain
MAVMAGLRLTVVPDRTRAPDNEGRIRTPARLTRRGRIVAAGAAALAVTALSMALATTAQATHTGSAVPGAGAARVTVLPGQSLWSLAESYDPGVDPRAIVEQIRQLNSLPGYQLQAGTVLWVPRG